MRCLSCESVSNVLTQCSGLLLFFFFLNETLYMLLNIAQLRSWTHQVSSHAPPPPPHDHVLWVMMLLQLLSLYLNSRHTTCELICSVSWCDLFFMRANQKRREHSIWKSPDGSLGVFWERHVMFSMLPRTSMKIIQMLVFC